jgi:Spy/CpxP family protein refolding chaperone
MKKELFWKFSTFFLLGINLSLIAFWLLQSKPPHPGEGGKPDPIIIEGLGLDAQQITQFEKSKQAHRQAMMDINRSEKSVKSTLFLAISAIGTDSVQIQSLLQTLANYKQQKDQATLKHFAEIKAICKPEQLEKYPGVIHAVSEQLLRERPGPRPPKP